MFQTAKPICWTSCAFLIEFGVFAAAGLLAGFVGWPAALETLVVGFAADAGTAAGAGEPFLGAMVIADADVEGVLSETVRLWLI